MSQSNYNESYPPRLQPITVHKRHAVTSNLGKDTIRDINFTKNIAFYFMDHAIQCDHCAEHMKKAIKGVQN